MYSSGPSRSFWQLKKWHLIGCVGMFILSLLGIFLFGLVGSGMVHYPGLPAVIFIVAIFVSTLVFSSILPFFWLKEYRRYQEFNAEEHEHLSTPAQVLNLANQEESVSEAKSDVAR
ncbi:MAG: hypothetical protein ACNA8W_20675 [Bradymonadaceae bacterium]